MLTLVLAAFLQSAPPVRTVAKGPASAIEAPRQVAVRTPSEWADLWRAHTGGQTAAAQPIVDFDREMVLAVFLGSRPTGGYGVEIVRTVAANGGLLVEYVETAPGRDAITAQVLTAPYHLVAVPKVDGTVRFAKVER